MECVDCGYHLVDAFCPRCDPDPTGYSVSSAEKVAALPPVTGGDQRRAGRACLAFAAAVAVLALIGFVLALYRIGQLGPPLTRSGLDAIDATTPFATAILKAEAIGCSLVTFAVSWWLKPVMAHNKAVRRTGSRNAAFEAAGGSGWRSPQMSAIFFGLHVAAILGVVLAAGVRILWRPSVGLDPHAAYAWDAGWFLAQFVGVLAMTAVIPAATHYRQWRVSDQAAAGPVG
ncbi:MAG: hypothetical protein QOD41_1358 [Cryptosporangiaceae bacterium]|nr:hypothetical protein [Cryptosporangiaceae bacterium]